MVNAVGLRVGSLVGAFVFFFFVEVVVGFEVGAATLDACSERANASVTVTIPCCRAQPATSVTDP